jgi:cobalt-zinc-cadmium efflux system outer membrane protein
LREGRRLDLLAETARRYLDVAAAQGIAAIAREALQQRERMLTATAARVTAGGAPESVQLAAQAVQVRARADIVRAQRAHTVATRRLALMWDGEDGVDAVAGDAARLPSVPALAALEQRLANTPELRRFAHEARLREARLQLARSARVTDLEWQVGVRRLQSENDWGLVGTLSLPLGSAARAAPGIRAAEAELAALDLEREGEVRTLEATLLTAWHALDTAVADALQIEAELLPLLLRAEAAAERAFRAGALSYLEWSQLQTDILVARRERLDAAVAAHRALIELQRLTGDTFTPSAATLSDITP